MMALVEAHGLHHGVPRQFERPALQAIGGQVAIVLREEIALGAHGVEVVEERIATHGQRVVGAIGYHRILVAAHILAGAVVEHQRLAPAHPRATQAQTAPIDLLHIAIVVVVTTKGAAEVGGGQLVELLTAAVHDHGWQENLTESGVHTHIV